MKLHKWLIASGLAVLTACSSGAKTASAADADETDSAEVTVPAFSADSAYGYVARQVAFGPRVPGSSTHAACAAWLTSRLRDAGADTVLVQSASMTGAEGRSIPVRNIFARFNGNASPRILLIAHYDTRPWADEDPDAANHNRPIDGANDGASGVGVLLAVADALAAQSPAVGVDILLTDSEDSGVSGDDGDPADDLTWCLGTQHFVQNLPYPGRKPVAAILLDMVGGKDAVFRKEYFSATQATDLTDRVWRTAQDAGVGSRFVSDIGGAVNDDHIHLLRAGIPAVDIIEIGHPRTGSFNPTWHTMADNLDSIDPSTLDAVGRTVLRFIYTYK